MIDIDKIEEAARVAPYEAEWRYEPTGQTVWAGNTYMVADIRGWGHLQHLPNGEALQDATGVHIATANPSTVLEMVGMIRERDAVLKQALEAFGEVAQWESEGDTAHPASNAIAAIKGVLNERPD